MAELSAQTIDRAGDGLNPVLSAAAGGGDEFVNTGVEFLEIDNADASGKTVTIVTQRTIDGLAVADLVVTVPAGERRLVGPFAVQNYNDGNNKVQVTYSDVTSVTVGVFKLGST